MKLSVLIPMYNAEKYIGNCLDSLINQDLQKDDYEILVMDDGSTDTSAQIVTEYVNTHKNISLFKESNAGESATRNKLIKKAKGDYIYNFDADDYIANNCLGFLIDTAIENNLEIIGFETLLVDDSFQNINQAPVDFKQVNIVTQSGKDFIKNNRDMRHEVWWYIIDASFLKSTGLLFANNKFNADLVFTMQLFLNAKKTGFAPIKIHNYVQTPESVVRNPDIVKRKIYIDNLYYMMVDYSKLINSVSQDASKSDHQLIDNLKYRLDKGVFFNTIKMIRAGYTLKEVKENIKKLKAVNAYPIKHFIGKEYNSLSFKTLTGLFNNEKILYGLVWLYNLLPIK